MRYFAAAYATGADYSAPDAKSITKEKNVYLLNFLRRIVKSEDLAHNSFFFFSEQPFHGNYST